MGGRPGVLLLFLAGLCLAPGALAQAPAEVEAADERARELYQNGKTLYTEGRYEDAIAAWEEAFRLSERPLLLFNLANAYERAGQYEEALDRMQRYRAFAAAEERDVIASRILNLEERVAEARQDQAELERLAAERQRLEEEKARKEAELEAERRRLAELAAAQAAAEADKGFPVLPVVVGGVGVASLVAGAVFTLGAGSNHRELDDLCSTSGERTLCPSEADELLVKERRNRVLAEVGFAVGLVGLGGGTALFLGHRQDPPDESALWVAPRDDGAVVGVSGAF